jgi:hypothetical protein
MHASLPKAPPAARFPLPLLLAVTFLGALSNRLQAESLTRSDPQTAGEKRLLEWDLNKTYDLGRGRTNLPAKVPSRSFFTRLFKSDAYIAKTFPTESFSTTEFLFPKGKVGTKPFANTRALTLNSSNLIRPFASEKLAAQPNAAPAFPPGDPVMARSFLGADRPYRGPESLRKEQKYTPGNAPNGGIIEGRQLSVDEVKEILNKSK